MINALRPYFSRLIAPLVAALLLYLGTKGINLPEDAAGHLTEVGAIALVAVFQIISAIVHRTVDKKVNPADAAGANEAAEGKIMASRSVTRDVARSINERQRE